MFLYCACYYEQYFKITFTLLFFIDSSVNFQFNISSIINTISTSFCAYINIMFFGFKRSLIIKGGFFFLRTFFEHLIFLQISGWAKTPVLCPLWHWWNSFWFSYIHLHAINNMMFCFIHTKYFCFTDKWKDFTKRECLC